MNRITVARVLSHRALNAMTDKQLTELVKVDRETLRIHKVNAIGHPGYYSSDFVRKECNRAKYEIHAIEKILMRRTHAALETQLDVQATADAVAA